MNTCLLQIQLSNYWLNRIYKQLISKKDEYYDYLSQIQNQKPLLK